MAYFIRLWDKTIRRNRRKLSNRNRLGSCVGLQSGGSFYTVDNPANPKETTSAEIKNPHTDFTANKTVNAKWP